MERQHPTYCRRRSDGEFHRASDLRRPPQKPRPTAPNMTSHLRVWRRVRLFPGCTINIGKRGVSSFSFGVRGAHYTVGRKNRRATIGMPGTGIFATAIKPRGHDTADGYMWRCGKCRGPVSGPSERCPSCGYQPPPRNFLGAIFLIAGTTLAILGLLLSASCAPVTWNRTGASQAEFRSDTAACQMKADEGILIPGLPGHWMELCMQSRGYQARAAQ